MKNKKLLALLVAMVAMMCMLLTSCGGPKTLEDYYNSDSDFQSEMAQIEASNDGLTLSFSGNTVTYDFDIAALGSITEEQSKLPAVKAQLDSALDAATSQFTSIIQDLEDESGMEGVVMVVNYKYGDTIITTASFDKDGKK